MTNSLLLAHEADGVLSLTLNRPEKQNALNAEMYLALAGALNGAATRSSVHVILLAASGPAFCVGTDLSEIEAAPPTAAGSAAFVFLRALVTQPKPLIAAVHGAAIGIGATLLLHCDLVLAEPQARLRFPFVSLGLCPEAGSSILLPRIVGRHRASDWLTSGRAITAAETATAGLVSEIIPTQELAARSLTRAAEWARAPLPALLATKRLLRECERSEVLETLERERMEFAALLATSDVQSRLSRILTKDRPIK